MLRQPSKSKYKSVPGVIEVAPGEQIPTIVHGDKLDSKQNTRKRIEHPKN